MGLLLLSHDGTPKYLLFYCNCNNRLIIRIKIFNRFLNLRTNEMLLESILLVEEGREGKASRTFCSAPQCRAQSLVQHEPWQTKQASCPTPTPQALVPVSSQWLAGLTTKPPSAHTVKSQPSLTRGGMPGPGTSCQHRTPGR